MYILLVYERELSKNNYLKNTTKKKKKKKKLSKIIQNWQKSHWQKSHYLNSSLRTFRCNVNVRYIGRSSLSPGSSETQQGWS